MRGREKGCEILMERSRGPASSSMPCDLFERLVLDGSSSKTCQVSSVPTAVEILERSLLKSLGARSLYQKTAGKAPVLQPAMEGASVGALWMHNGSAGLAQRRERVFIVADLGAGGDTEKVFPLLESVPRHPPACVAARQKSSRRAAGGSRSKSIWEQIAGAFRYGAAPKPAQLARTIGAAHGGG